MTKNDNKKLKEIIDLACEEAKRLGNTKVSPEHLFLGMLRMDQARAIDVLIALGVDFYEVKAKIEQKLNKQRDKSEEMPDELDLTLAANSIVKRVIEEAWKLGDEEVESEHLMLAMLRNQAGFVTKLFNSMGVDYEKFKEQLLKEKTRMQSDYGEESDEDEDAGDEESMYNPYRQNGPAKSDTPVLDNFGIDITKAAEEGTLDPIVGRDREIERLAQILSRRKKNNPVLIGEPGVGKSAIAEGLAIRIIQKKVSRYCSISG
jgi:ATP-dependent Clp protease ATP-binding subunit ClpC